MSRKIKEPTRARARGEERWVVPAICAGLFLLVWAVFGRTLGHDFINFDDNATVYESPAVPRGLSLDGIRWAFTHPVVGHWGPLTTLSHMLDCQLYGLEPWGHHLGNVVLHALAAVLLFLALRRLTGAVWRSGLAAAIFAVHPLRVESVAWVTERKDVLSGVFFALTLLAYAGYVRKPGWPRYSLLLATFIGGLLSKSMLVTVPLVLLLLDYWPGERWANPAWRNLRRPWNLLVEKLPLLALSAGASVLQIVAAREMITPLEKIAFSVRVGNALLSYAIYLRQMVWPADLAVLYPHPAAALPVGPVVLAALVLGLLSAVVWVERARRKWLAVGWLWYLIMLLPVIGLIQSGEIARADRYTYLPQIGICLAVSWGFGEMAARFRWRARTIGLTAAAALLLLGGAAALQASYWKDSETLWKHTLAQGVESRTAHENLGLALFQQDKVAEAIEQGREALKFTPPSPQVHTKLAAWLLRAGQLEESIAQERQALRLEPNNGQARTGLGYALLLKGDSAAALREYHAALQSDPSLAETHFALGLALAGLGRLEEAIVEYRESIRWRINYPEAHYNLGAALSKQGLVVEAMAEYREALRFRPRYADVHYDLGILLASTGHVDQAVPELREAVKNNPGFADAHNNLGAALTETGRIDEGIGHYRQAIELMPAGVNARMNLGMALAAKGALDDAIDQFESVLRLAPEHAEARQQLAAARQMKEALSAPSPVRKP